MDGISGALVIKGVISGALIIKGKKQSPNPPIKIGITKKTGILRTKEKNSNGVRAGAQITLEKTAKKLKIFDLKVAGAGRPAVSSRT